MKNDFQLNHESINVQSNTKIEGFVTLSEDERLLKDALRPGTEKLQLFTRMLRRNAMFSKAKPATKPK